MQRSVKYGLFEHCKLPVVIIATVAGRLPSDHTQFATFVRSQPTVYRGYIVGVPPNMVLAKATAKVGHVYIVSGE